MIKYDRFLPYRVFLKPGLGQTRFSEFTPEQQMFFFINTTIVPKHNVNLVCFPFLVVESAFLQHSVTERWGACALWLIENGTFVQQVQILCVQSQL